MATPRPRRHIRGRQPWASASDVDLRVEFPAWTELANCAGADLEAFYPQKGGSTAYAKRVCGRCPVTAECLESALERDERFGVFGGLSERERRKLKRQAVAA